MQRALFRVLRVLRARRFTRNVGYLPHKEYFIGLSRDSRFDALRNANIMKPTPDAQYPYF